MNISRLFTAGAFVTLLAASSIGICNYFTRRQLSMELSLGDFGLFYGALGIFNILIAVIDCGLNNTVTMYLARQEAETDSFTGKSLLRKALAIKIITAIFITAVMLFLSDPICRYYFHYPEGILIFRIAVFYCISYEFLLFFTAVCNGLKEFVRMNLLQMSFYIPALAFLLIFSTEGEQKDIIAVISFIAGSFCIFLPACFFLWKRFFRDSSRGVFPWATLWSSCRWFMLGTILFTLLGFMDIILISSFLGVKSAGIYNIAVAVSMICAPLSFVSSLSLPIICDCWERKEYSQIGKLVNNVLSVWTFMFWCGAMFFLLFSGDVITLLFSEKFSAAAPALMILGPGILLNVLLLFLYGVINGIGELKKAGNWLLLGVGCNLAVSFITIRCWGIAGGACGTAFGYLAISVIYFAILRRKFHSIRMPVIQHFCGIFLYICAALWMREPAFWIRGIFLFLSAIFLLIMCIRCLLQPGEKKLLQ